MGTRLNETLTAEELRKVHEFKLTAGKTYVIDMESKDRDTFLKLESADSKKLAENDDIEDGKNLNSRILFTPPAAGVYRIIATSFEGRGSGAYTLTIREFVGKLKVSP